MIISGEHIILFVILLFIFGPKTLPQLGRALGKTIRNFKDIRSGIQEPEFRHLKKDERPDKHAE